VVSLLLALLINAAILILSASAFNLTGHTDVTEIDSAYRLLEPIVGSLASFLFAIALLASGQSSTFTGTIAGQIVFEGFLKLKIPCWKRRLITRALALVPAWLGVWILGDGSIGKLLVLTQVVLSFQLPFAIYPLLRFTGNQELMGRFKNQWFTGILAWILFLVITIANIWLIYRFVS
jgi:manganese transport protein